MDVFKANSLNKTKPKKIKKLTNDHLVKMHNTQEEKKRLKYDKPECVFCDFKKSKSKNKNKKK